MAKLLWTTEKRKVSDLKDHPSNQRTLSKASHDELLKSFKEFDYVELVAIDTENTILAGHQRIHIMIELGWNEKEIDVRIPNRKLTEKEAKKYLLRSNKNVGEWNYDVLANEFEIDELLDVGFTEDELLGSFDLDEEKEFDEIEKEQDISLKTDDSKIISKKGDIYHLNNHILFCDDSSKINFDSKNSDNICFTDPPYEMQGSSLINILKKTNCDHFLMITSFKQAISTLSKDDFIFHFDFVINAKIPKSFMNRKQPYYTHQTGIYFSNNDDTIFNNDNSKGRRSDDTSTTGYWHTIIESPRNTKQGHGHAKNVRGMCDVLAGFKFKKIIDPFCGSGTSLLCAEFFKCDFIGCELDPKFCDLTIKRFILNLIERKKDITIKKNGESIDYNLFLD